MSTPLQTLQSVRQPSVIDGAKITETIQRALTEAGLDGTSGVAGLVNDTIRRALSSAGLMAKAAELHEPSGAVDDPRPEARGEPRLGLSGGSEASHIVARDQTVARGQTVAREQTDGQAQFLSRSYSNAAGTRRYKLYIPSSYAGKPTPLIVMLHGCTQDPDDFAAGTRMNEWAERDGLLVLYPAQSANANGAKCWNWFQPAHQATDRGEPSLIAGMIREVTSSYAVDPRRVFIAGLSAGAAMAVVLGATYPELIAGVGAHSGLPYGTAYDVPSALAAMRGGGSLVDGGQLDGGQRSRTGKPDSPAAPMHMPPTIVFHGDRDATVNCTNGAAIVAGAVRSAAQFGKSLNKTVQERQSADGGRYTTTIYRDSMMRPHVEEWVLHGSGHAWSGGSPQGSHTDVRGPDASAEMLRFFLAQTSR